MSRCKKLLPLFLLLVFGVACARVQHYTPAPIVPVASAHRLEARRLTSPGLERFLASSLGRPVSPWPLRQWDLQTLTLAALYFNPQMQIARDQLAVAKAAIITAGEKPNPTLKLTPGIPSPYLLDLRLKFPIETHGRRKLRIEQAKRLSLAARIAVAETAWKVASGLRKALLAYQVAGAKLALDRSTERLETSRVTLLGRMLTTGEGSRPALETAQLALSNIRFAIGQDEGSVATSRAALAGAIGVPEAALNGVELSWPHFASLPSLASLSPRQIQRDAVLNRLDVHRALAQYAAADAALRLQLARQYPNFIIGPGYSYSDPYSDFVIPFNIILPIRNRNQGPIAQAAALRKEAAANFLAVQARAIAQSEQALAAYRSAIADMREANRPLQNQLRRVQLTRRALAAGETGRLQLNALLLQGTVYAQQHLLALAQAQAAFGALENAVERPLGPDAGILPVRAPAPASRGGKESKP
jgi:outer membrane protein TolC